MHACLYHPFSDSAGAATLMAVAQAFSPRYERHGDGVVVIDVSGLGRLLGDAHAIGEALGRDVAARGLRARVAVARTQTAAIVLAHARPGLTVVPAGGERAALAGVPLGVLEKAATSVMHEHGSLEPLRSAQALSNSAGGGAPARIRKSGAPCASKNVGPREKVKDAVTAFKAWGLRTLGELAALPPADLAARLGRQAAVWQAIARGEDVGPLVPDVEEERFESSIDLEWPIEGLEPLSFVLTRLLEPLSIRLERRDRGVAVLYVILGLVADPSTGTSETCTRRLELPSPLREVRALRTLALLDLDAHPPASAIERVTVTIEPTPGRIVQHTLYARALPTPEQLSTLLARLGALMGQDRMGAPATVDTYRPGAFAMKLFSTEQLPEGESLSLMARGPTPSRARESTLEREAGGARGGGAPRATRNAGGDASVDPSVGPLISALRRFRQPVAARVTVAGDRPVRIVTDRRGFAGGDVVHAAGPWRVSGEWWTDNRYARDEWDVALSDRVVYRVFRDANTGRWFIDGVVD